MSQNGSGATSGTAQVDPNALIAAYRSRRRTRTIRTRVIQVIILILLGVGWWFTEKHFISDFWISTPGAVVERSWDWGSSGFIWSHVWITFREMLYGLIIGTACGLAVGIILAVRKNLSDVLNPYVMVAFAIPNLALTPLFILFFGIGMVSKVALVATVVFFFIFYNTFAGVRDVNRDLVNIVKIMGGSEFRVIRSVLLPSATGWILTGMRLSLRQALAAAVVGEMLAGSEGLGYLLALSSGTFDSTGLFAALVYVTIIAVILNALAALVERHLTRWKGSAANELG